MGLGYIAGQVNEIPRQPGNGQVSAPNRPNSNVPVSPSVSSASSNQVGSEVVGNTNYPASPGPIPASPGPSVANGQQSGNVPIVSGGAANRPPPYPNVPSNGQIIDNGGLLPNPGIDAVSLTPNAPSGSISSGQGSSSVVAGNPNVPVSSISNPIPNNHITQPISGSTINANPSSPIVNPSIGTGAKENAYPPVVSGGNGNQLNQVASNPNIPVSGIDPSINSNPTSPLGNSGSGSNNLGIPSLPSSVPISNVPTSPTIQNPPIGNIPRPGGNLGVGSLITGISGRVSEIINGLKLT